MHVTYHVTLPLLMPNQTISLSLASFGVAFSLFDSSAPLVIQPTSQTRYIPAIEATDYEPTGLVRPSQTIVLANSPFDCYARGNYLELGFRTRVIH